MSHSLDVTASSIDSNVGQLDGYLTIIFEGDNTPRKATTKPKDHILTNEFVFPGTEPTDDKSNKDSKLKTEKATLENVRNYYLDMSSTVCRIKVNDYSAYTHGEVFERGLWKIGVISVTSELLNEAVASNVPTKSMKAVQENIYKLRYEDEVDLVFVVAPDQKITKYLDKVDCAICKTVSDDVSDSGKTDGSIYVMRVPDAGYIGTVLSTPAKMLAGNIYNKVEIKPEEDSN